MSTHDRQAAHFGTQPDTTITTTEALGPLPAGTTLNTVMAYLYGAATDITAYPRFGLDAYIQPYVGLDAVIRKTQETSLGLDAWLAGGGAFGLSAIVRSTPSGTPFGLSAYVVGSQSWNVVQSPVNGGTATYSAISPYANVPASAAANGITYYDFFGDAWEKNGNWAAGDWWQVAWNVGQPINRVILYGPRQSDGSPLSDANFGTAGRLEFSDGSTVNWSGWSNPQLPLTIDFAARTTTYLRVISDSGGLTRSTLAEVEAFNTEQWG